MCGRWVPLRRPEPGQAPRPELTKSATAASEPKSGVNGIWDVGCGNAGSTTYRVMPITAGGTCSRPFRPPPARGAVAGAMCVPVAPAMMRRTCRTSSERAVRPVGALEDAEQPLSVLSLVALLCRGVECAELVAHLLARHREGGGALER